VSRPHPDRGGDDHAATRPKGRHRRLVGPAVKVAFSLLGLSFIGVELARNWHQAHRLTESWPRLIVAVAIGLAVVAISARAWTALLGRHGSSAISRGFYLSQFGKYVPGGIWQAVGQIGFARDEGIGLAQASAAFSVYAVVQVIAGAGVGSVFAAISPDLRTAWRLAIIAGALLTVLLHRGWMRAVLEVAARFVPRLHGGLLPGQRGIVLAYAWTAAGLSLAGVLFAVLLEPSGLGWWLAAISAFVTAWWIGFVALPFPSGIGIREAVLVGLLAPHITTGSILVASIGQRLIAIAAELTMVAQATVRVRRAARQRPAISRRP
jgi:hypothetical protein